MRVPSVPHPAAWLPALCWGALIFYVSSQPAGDLPSHWLLAHDKLIHAGVFGVFSVCLYLAAHVGHGRGAWFSAAAAFLGTALYGIVDEYHQVWTPGRVPDLMDWLADIAGAACVFLLPLLPSRHEPVR